MRNMVLYNYRDTIIRDTVAMKTVRVFPVSLSDEISKTGNVLHITVPDL